MKTFKLSLVALATLACLAFVSPASALATPGGDNSQKTGEKKASPKQAESDKKKPKNPPNPCTPYCVEVNSRGECTKTQQPAGCQ